MSCMLIRTFGTGANSGMTWHYQLFMILYGVMNVTQLALLLLKPELYQRYRFQVGVLGGGGVLNVSALFEPLRGAAMGLASAIALLQLEGFRRL